MKDNAFEDPPSDVDDDSDNESQADDCDDEDAEDPPPDKVEVEGMFMFENFIYEDNPPNYHVAPVPQGW